MMSRNHDLNDASTYNGQTAIGQGGPYTDSEVVSIVEENLNEPYADPDHSNEIRYISTKLFEVSKSGGLVNQDALDSLYVKALAFASKHFYCDIPEDPANLVPVACDVFVDSSELNYLRVGVTSIVGEKITSSSGVRKVFHVGDDHPAIYGDPCHNGAVPATIIIPPYITHNLKPPVGPLRGYFTNIKATTVWALDVWGIKNDDDSTPNDLIMDYLTYQVSCWYDEDPGCPKPVQCWGGHSEDEVRCLEYDEMNFYLDNIEFSTTRFLKTQGDDKKLVHFGEIGYTFGLCLYTYSYLWYPHLDEKDKYAIKYGDYHKSQVTVPAPYPNYPCEE